MPSLTWSEQYAIGVELIDQQHLRLVELINRVYELAATKKGDVGSVLVDLAEHAQTHFRDEEDLMRQVGHPGLAHHHQLHKQLAAVIERFQKDLDSGRPVSMRELLGFLRDWLTSHIQREDKKIGEFVAAQHRQAAGAQS